MEGTFYDAPNDYRSYLVHHGVKGMRWGIRRYQNEDGSLTNAGRKHYDRVSGEKTYKELHKEIKKRRKEQYGWSNQWMHSLPIGENSKKIHEQLNANKKKYTDTPEYKEWNSKMNDLDKRINRLLGSYDAKDKKLLDKYEKQWYELSGKQPRSNEKMMPLYMHTIGKDRKYTDFLGNDYLKNAGKSVTMAYLKDLGYNDETAKELLEKMLKENRTLGV